MTSGPLAAHLNRLIWFSLLPLLLLAVWMAVDRVRTDQLEIEEAAGRRLNNYIARIDSFLEARMLALKLLAASPLADDPGHLADLYAEAQAYRANFGSHLIFADATGKMQLNTRAPLGAVLPHISSNPDHAGNIALATGQPAISNLFIGQLTQEPMLAIAVPGMREGKARHLMLTVFPAEQFQQHVAQIAMQPGWALSLHDGNGKLIARLAPPNFDPERDTDPRWRFTQQLRFAPWTVSIEVPRKIQQAPLIESSLALALGIILATLAGMLGSARVARRINRQVTSLVAPTAPDTSPEEITEIAAARRLIATSHTELRASAERLNQAQRMAQVGNWTLDLPDGPLRWSDEIFRIFEIDPARFPASYEAFLACVHPEDRKAVNEAYRHSLETRQPYSIVHRLQFPDGRVKYVHERCETDYGPDGSPLQSRGTVQNITERVRAEQERERLASILEATTDIVSMADPQGHVIYFNGPGRALLGIEPEGALPEVIAKVHPQWATDIILREGLPTAIRTGTWSGETALLGPGGQEIPVSQVILSHKDNDGNLLFLSTIMRDIRESRAAAQALRESEERLRLALTAASQGLYDLALVTGDAKVSPEYATMLGYDPVAFRETNAAWRERLHPDDQATVYKAYEDYVAGRLSEYRVEFRQRTRDGSWKWVLSLGRIQEWSPDGRPLRMLGTHTDIDAIKAAEASLRYLNATLEARVAQRTAELTAANQELESFAYAVSHDLRAPLRAMSGFALALQEDYGDTLTGDAKRYLDQIDLASHRMSDLIDGLLTLSRSTRGELRHEPVDLSALARRCLARVARDELQRHVTIEVEPGLHAVGDQRMLEVVIDNLIDNACKYTGRTAAPHIRVHAGLVNGVRGFCVSDNGAGFDMAHAARLFKPFQRLHRQEEFPGTGIGLATVQRIVHRHGGEIVAQGKPGEGASFCFTLSASGLEKPS
jgi:PAS domain S-box-containing protein